MRLRAPQGAVAQAVLVLALVLALRLPFLDQAIQGDDFYYLKGAERAQVEPLHPNHARYPFLGEMVDMRGHPHPPLVPLYLGAVLAVTGDEREWPYHLAFLLWSVMAVWGTLALARRFVRDRALAATVLFCATLPFVINGTSLEADLPLLGCWTAAAACIVYAVDRRSVGLAITGFAAGALAGLAAYQAILLVPIFGVYCWWRERRWSPGWAATLGAPAAIAAYQVFERVSSGAVPAAVLAGYLGTHNFQALSSKVKSAVALTVHLGWVICPALAVGVFGPRVPRWLWVVAAGVAAAGVFVDSNPLFWASLGIGALVALWCLWHLRAGEGDVRFLCWWVVAFFAAALVLFFAGSARYLLPLSPAVAMVAARAVRARWVYAAVAANLALGLLLAQVNYEHWDGYREFAAAMRGEVEGHRTWVNGEWGLRHYLEEEGALPYEIARPPDDGDLVVSTGYAAPIQAPVAALKTERIESDIPLRLVAIGSKSGFSSIAFGMRPFDISRAPMDIVRAEVVSQPRPALPRIVIGSPEAAAQIVSGVYNSDRWMGARAVVVLRRPADATRLSAEILIPDNSPARTFALFADDREIARGTFPRPGKYTLVGPAPAGDSVTVAITADRTFTAPPDTRALSAVLLDVGFR